MTKEEEADLQYDLGGMERKASKDRPPHHFIMGSDRRFYCSKCRALMNDPRREYCSAVVS